MKFENVGEKWEAFLPLFNFKPFYLVEYFTVVNVLLGTLKTYPTTQLCFLKISISYFNDYYCFI